MHGNMYKQSALEPATRELLINILKNGVLPAAGAAGNAAAWDKYYNPDRNLFKDVWNGDINPTRGMQAGFNALLGGLGGFEFGRGNTFAGASTLALSPVKDLAIGAIPLVDKTKEVVNQVPGALDTAASNNNKLNWILGALGLGALGLAGVGVAKYLKSKDPGAPTGKVQYKLKGKAGDPNTEAMVELPIDNPGIPPRMVEGLNSGIRRQLGRTVRYNMFKRDPETKKLIPFEEWHKKYVENKPAKEGDGQPAEKEASVDASIVQDGDNASVSGVGLVDAIDALHAGMSKESEDRGWAEGAGTMMTVGGGGLAGTAIGVSQAHRAGMSPFAGGLVGGLAGAFLPLLAGKALASLTPSRTPEEQEEHDNQLAFKEYIVPGYAAFQSDKRVESQSGNVARSFEATGSMGEGFSDSDFDDLEKDGGYMPPPPAGTVPPDGMMQQPAPLPGNVAARVPVKPNPSPSQPSPGHPDMKGVKNTAETVARQAEARQATGFTVEAHVVGLYKSAAAMDEVRGIMDTVYRENPSYWPYGLSPEGHDSLYIVRDTGTRKAAGFVGWQEHSENGRRIGSYSVGILPEYRGNGYAKEAVAKVVREKSAGVDEVRAYVMPHNGRSAGLAASLGIPVTREF